MIMSNELVNVFNEVKMNRFYDIFSKIRSSSGFFFVMTLLFVYFSVYFVKGERGLIKYFYLTDEVNLARAEYAKKSKERKYWNEQVNLLSSNLDLDLLDERVRTVLNMVGPNEFVILDEKLSDK